MNVKYKVDHMNGPEKPGTVLFLHQDAGFLDQRTELSSFRRIIQPLLSSESFKGEFKEGVNIIQPADENCLILVGLGKKDELTEGRLSEATALGVSMARRLNLREVTLAIPPLENIDPRATLGLMVLGSKLGAHKRTTFKTDPGPSDEHDLKTVTLCQIGSKDPLEKAQQVVNRATVMAEAQLEARRLADLPGNLLFPLDFAEEAKRVALKHKLRITVWEEDKLALEGAWSILAVGQGSSHPPAVVIVEYFGRSPNREPIALVGKGVTFDSGGLCLKPSENMGSMKSDMSGAAVVLSVIAAAAEMRLPQHLVGVMPMAENMPGGKAFRPGDIVKTLSGQTVEVINTDAEGRMLLCDALGIAQKYKPSEIIDIATLTGACVVALGDRVAGLFTESDRLHTAIVDAGRSVGEYFWRLPLFSEYDDNLKSDLADLRHMSGRPAGALHAALFLRRFVKPKFPWVHLDIAGTARRSKASAGYPEGATGFGVRTLLKYLIDNQRQHSQGVDE
ncbi:MAG: leucyl aminopeptidase [Deltaproteobacteria bacterium]|jgi:leucyl aminopeptidase|nr:leucyl aminopeptidase [Deltaproteobacteria bacterium]